MIGFSDGKVKFGVNSPHYLLAYNSHRLIECPLPSLSHLLENSRVRDTDSLVICVQIHCPVGPSIPQQPSVYYVPRDLLDGLESSLDNPSEFDLFLIQYFELAELCSHSLDTGDVRFVCLEKYGGRDGSITLDASSTQSTSTNLSDSISPFGSHTIARKRIIYAHSDILTRRSEYFATMLSSSFAENSAISTGERKLYTIVVEEADFETIYWLLKYCYANWLLFKQDDDPRLAVEGVGAGWSARWLSGHQGEWDWKAVNKRGPGDDETGDSRSATSGESLPLSSAVSRSTSRKSDTYHPNPVQNNSSTSTSTPVARTIPAKPATTSSTSRPTNSTAASSRRTATVHSTSNPVTMSVGGSSPNLPRIKPGAVPSSSTFPPSPQYPVSPRNNRHPTSMASSSDPHPHPTPAPAPASALSIYQVAHRYIMPNLATLALEHIMSTITPQSSFALLLATSSWDELHPLVEVGHIPLSSFNPY